MDGTFNLQHLSKTALAIAVVAILADPTWAQSDTQNYQPQTAQQQTQQQATPDQSFQQVAAKNQTEVGIEGFCPVCVIKLGKWVIGDTQYPVAYDGKTYFFPGEQTRETFLADPAAYVPALGGDCIVCYENNGKRAPGNIRFSSLHKNRLFLFPNEELMDEFNQSPAEYQDTDLAADGNCIVCQAKAGKSVAGDEQFTAVYNGFRYLFPSDSERQEFVRHPKQYVAAVSNKATMKETSMTKGQDQQTLVSAEKVQVNGMTACAGCEFGVTPLGAPEELGLAVKSNDGKVYVIEDGHSRWPGIYKKRFNGQQVAVSGTVIKTQGNVAWIKPADMKTL